MKKILLLLFVLMPLRVYAIGDLGVAFEFMFFCLVVTVLNLILTYKNRIWKKLPLTIINTLLSLPLMYGTSICLDESGLVPVLMDITALFQLYWLWNSVEERTRAFFNKSNNDQSNNTPEI